MGDSSSIPPLILRQRLICGCCRWWETGSRFHFLQTEFNELNGQFSPDGRWIAYTSDESGRNEIYVGPFPGPGGKQQISTSGGRQPKWRGDGKEIFYSGPR